MTNKEIADILDEMGSILELRGENPFKCRAFQNAARVVSTTTDDLRKRAEEGTLTEITGIGRGLTTVITELVRTGRSAEHEALRDSVPSGLLTLLTIQGLGPKKVRILHERLGIDSPAKLRTAARQNRLADLQGFGKKSQENILRGLDFLSISQDYHLYPAAEAIAQRILKTLRSHPSVSECCVAGSLRRKKGTIGDIDILVSARKKDASRILRHFTGHEDVEAVLSSGTTKASVRTRGGIQCDVRVVSAKEYPFALCYFTGSKEHNVGLRARARTRGLSLNEYGFTRSLSRGGGKRQNTGGSEQSPRCASEAAIYGVLGMAYIPPEMRENTGEIEAATAGPLPDLVSPDDLTGTFHCHTTYSDGRNSLKEMVDAAIELQWNYIGIADHSKVAVYAGGLSEKDVNRQLEEIARLNGLHSDFRVFAGTEVDILPDGSLDWSDSLLSRFDYVVASIHSSFRMTETEATRRIIRAIRNRKVTMLGHPTGRLLLQREGYPVNIKEVIDAASDYGTIIEINAHPMRLDLDWTHCKYAREKKVPISINPDAHTTEGLLDVRYGVHVARKGWLSKKDVFNTRSLKEIRKHFNRQ